GYVGYLGYELKADCGTASTYQASTPDACLLLADRMLAFDHEEGAVYGLCLVGGRQDQLDAEAWLFEVEAIVTEVRDRRTEAAPAASRTAPVAPTPVLRHDRGAYLDLIAECQRHILDGDSYEICLTNTLSTEPLGDPLGAYLALRRLNPAPFGAFLRLGGVSVLSSSPERFLRVEPDGTVETKPVKGTVRRSSRQHEDEELRRSLVESDKVRTMEILDRLEGGARGVYSGAIGYFGLGGAADWSIVIRTIVNTPHAATVGVGGAITALSDPAAEFEETMLKAAAVLCALGAARAGGRPGGRAPGQSRRQSQSR